MQKNFSKHVPCVISGLLLWTSRICHRRLIFLELFSFFSLFIVAYAEFHCWVINRKANVNLFCRKHRDIPSLILG